MIADGQPSIVARVGMERRVEAIPGADSASFRPLPSAEDAYVIYAVDANAAYIGRHGHSMILQDADPATFAITASDGSYASDKDRVFWYGVEVEGANPATFKPLRPPYGIDDKRAYIGCLPIEVDSLEGFEVIEAGNFQMPILVRSRELYVERDFYLPGWARDGISYYCEAVKLEGADYDSVAILNQLYARDKNTVYFKGKSVVGADAATFVTDGPGVVSGHDKIYKYKNGQRIK